MKDLIVWSGMQKKISENIPAENMWEDTINSDKNTEHKLNSRPVNLVKKFYMMWLIMTIMPKICIIFLGLTQPIKKFPHSNKT